MRCFSKIFGSSAPQETSAFLGYSISRGFAELTQSRTRIFTEFASRVHLTRTPAYSVANRYYSYGRDSTFAYCAKVRCSIVFACAAACDAFHRYSRVDSNWELCTHSCYSSLLQIYRVTLGTQSCICLASRLTQPVRICLLYKNQRHLFSYTFPPKYLFTYSSCKKTSHKFDRFS